MLGRGNWKSFTFRELKNKCLDHEHEEGCFWHSMSHLEEEEQCTAVFEIHEEKTAVGDIRSRHTLNVEDTCCTIQNLNVPLA